MTAGAAESRIPHADGWGVDSEVGRLRRVLVASPEHFRWLEANQIAQQAIRSGARFDRDAALRQHSHLLDLFREQSVAVELLPADPALPFQVYARDSSVMTPYGAIIAQLAPAWRRGEYAPAIQFYREQEIPIFGMVSAGTLEGGDVQLLKPGLALIGYSETRSNEGGAEQAAGWLRAEGWDVRTELIPEYFVHIDLLVCAVAPNVVAVSVDVASDGLQQWLRDRGYEIVPVSYRETVALGCNVVALGDETVLASSGSPELNARLRALGLTVLEPDLSMFTRVGGGTHCLCQPLRRDAIAHG